MPGGFADDPRVVFYFFPAFLTNHRMRLLPLASVFTVAVLNVAYPPEVLLSIPPRPVQGAFLAGVQFTQSFCLCPDLGQGAVLQNNNNEV